MAGLLSGGQRACRSAVTKEFGEAPPTDDKSPEAMFAIEREHRAHELAANVETDKISPGRCLRMTLHAITGFKVKFSEGSLKRFNAMDIADEINTVLQLVLTEHSARLARISSAISREFTRSKLEEMIHER